MDPAYRDRALALGDALVIADLHFGKGAASNVEFPLGAGDNVIERLEDLLDHFESEEVILAGDTFHSFDSVPLVARDAFSDLLDVIRDAGARPVVIEGNHDTMLDTVWSGEIHGEYEIDTGEPETTTVVCHGHEEPETRADHYVIGHDHPSIVIEGQKRPCWLHGRDVFERSNVLVVPSFNRLVEGVSVNGRIGGRRPELSPLVTRVGQFRPIVYDDDAEETLEFPPLGQFQRML